MPRLRTLAITSAAFALATSASTAKDQPARAPIFQQVLDCRSLAEADKRLACYDAAASKMAQAESSGQIAVIDQDQARAVRRQAFGFNLPSLDFFRGKAKETEVSNITATVKRAFRDANGKWHVVLDDGAVWVQIDTNELLNPPHTGSTVAIRKAALGSFFMNVDGQRAIRATRQQ